MGLPGQESSFVLHARDIGHSGTRIRIKCQIGDEVKEKDYPGVDPTRAETARRDFADEAYNEGWRSHQHGEWYTCKEHSQPA